jgi:hypothetical protein
LGKAVAPWQRATGKHCHRQVVPKPFVGRRIPGFVAASRSLRGWAYCLQGPLLDFPRAAVSNGLSGSLFLEFEVHGPSRISRLPSEYPYRHGRTGWDDDAVPFVHRELTDVAFGRPNRMGINVLVAGPCAAQNSSLQNGAGGGLAEGRVHVDGSHRQSPRA